MSDHDGTFYPPGTRRADGPQIAECGFKLPASAPAAPEPAANEPEPEGKPPAKPARK